MRVVGISGLDRSVAFKQEEFPELSARQYRIAQGFDAAAALVDDSGVVAAAAEERFSLKKATGAFPAGAIDYCLRAGGVSIDEIDFLAHGFSYEPFREYYQNDEFTRRQYEQVYAPEVQRQLLKEHYPDVDWEQKFVPVVHHLAHAASAFYMSGFDDALIVITDGMGEVHSMTALAGSPSGMEVIRQVPALHSVGILYGAFTLYLGFFMGLDEYKVMGLAPYGNPRKYFNDIMEFVQLQDDGTYRIPLFAHNKTLLEKETHEGVLKVLEEKFGPRREPESELTQHSKDVAAALQAVLQTVQLHLLKTLKKETGLSNLCMAGGVALNCTANGVIRRSKLFKKMFIQPASGDDGTSLGAALYVLNERSGGGRNGRMTLPLWGPEFTDEDIQRELSGRDDCTFRKYDDMGELAREAARRIAGGEIISWFQGRMEFGPRALGSRSILADPRAADMRDRINSLVKKREGFRPFAPAVTEEAASTYFEVASGDEETDAHMLYVMQVKKAHQEELPAITHVDGSARPQTVSRALHPHYWEVIHQVGELTGIPMVLNTSFNVRGQPIVCTPKEGVDTFLFASLDALVIGSYLVLPEPGSGDVAREGR